MNRWSYTREDLASALRHIGLARGSTVLVHVSLGLLGQLEGCRSEVDHCLAMHEVLRDVIGPEGTLLVPTYTYSFCRNEPFDLSSSPSTIGPFTEYFRLQPNVHRSRDPIFSVCGEGPRAMELLQDLPPSCFGVGCVYDRLRTAHGIVCTIGVGLHYATFRHHIEEIAAVPFRYRKRFTGTIIDGADQRFEEWIYSVSLLASNGQAEGHALENILRSEGLCRVAPITRSYIMGIQAEDYFSRARELFIDNPWLSARGPAGDPAALEDARVGKLRYTIPPLRTLDHNQRIDTLEGIPIFTVSDGAEAAMNAVAEYVGGDIRSFPTGTQRGHLLVPEKWIPKSAEIRRISGEVVLSTASGSCAATPYSLKHSGRVTKQVLQDHLYTDQKISLDDKRTWGVSVCANSAPDLNDAEYQVEVDCAFSFSKLYICEARAPGSNAWRVATLQNIPALVTIAEEFLSSQNFSLVVVPDERWIALLDM